MSEEDIIAFVQSSVPRMAEWTFSFISSIVGIESKDEGIHVGSAFRLVVGSRRVLVTAKHVFDAANSAKLGGGYTDRRGDPPKRLPSAPDIVDPVADLVVIFIADVGAPETADLGYWPLNRCDESLEAREHDYLFVHGFPGSRARFLFGGLHRLSLPYGVMERDDDLPEGMASFQFAMDYDPSNMRLPDGEEATLVIPSGLSGSPVWRIGAYKQDPRSWKPEHAMLVGIVTQWNSEKRVLIATGIEMLRRLLESSS